MPDESRNLKNAFARFATGVTVVTCQPQEGPAVGMTVNSFSSVSLDPALVLWCIDNKSSTFEQFMSAGHYGLSILGEDQEAASHRFATPGQHEMREGEGEAFVTGAPLLKGRLAGFDCRLEAKHRAGDHWILIGRVEHFDYCDGAPLIYSGRDYLKGPQISE